jgi:hypothetical protein
LVTGCGAVALTGPITPGVSMIQRIISTTSSRWIHEMYWRPLPIRPPTKNRNGRIIFGRAPAVFSRTTPVRSSTTRVPVPSAFLASASHSCVRRARKSSPGCASSVFGSAPDGP